MKIIEAQQKAADLIVESGQHFIVSNDLTYNSVTILQGGKLSFSKGVTFTAGKIDVYGVLEIGKPDEPFTDELNIHLNGEITSGTFGTVGRSMITQSGGKIDIYGVEKSHVTQLNSDARQGDSFILCDVPDDWKVGDEIVIAPSFPVQGSNDDESERFTITSIDAGKINLSGNVQNLHIGRRFDFNGEWVNGKGYDFRAHVINLTRNIKFTCKIDEVNSRNGDGKVKKGAHIMAMPGGHMTAIGIEITGYGQTEEQGRYPWHWHSFGENNSADYTGQYIKYSSVHDSNHRGYAQHGSGTTVDSCVLYNFLSHGFVFAEQRNNVNNTLINCVGINGQRLFRKSSSNNHHAFGGADNISPGEFTKFYQQNGKSSQFERIPGFAWGENYHNRVEGNVFAGGTQMNGIFFSGVSQDRVLKSCRGNIVYAMGTEANSNEGTAYSFPYRTVGHGIFCNFEEVEGTFRIANNLIYNCALSGAWLKPRQILFANNKIVGCGIGANVSRSRLIKNTFIEKFIQDSKTIREPEYCIEVGTDSKDEHSDILIKKNTIIGYDYILAVVKAKNDERFQKYNDVGSLTMVLGNIAETRKGDIFFKDNARNGVIVFKDESGLFAVMGNGQDKDHIGSNRVPLEEVASVVIRANNSMEGVKMNGVSVYTTEPYDSFQDGYYTKVESYVKANDTITLSGVPNAFKLIVTGLKGLNLTFKMPSNISEFSANYESAIFASGNTLTINRTTEPRTIEVDVTL